VSKVGDVIARARVEGRTALDEAAGKALLGEFDIRVPKSAVVAGPDDVEKLRGLIPPFAVKVVSREILHKSDAGGVTLNVADASGVARAIAVMAKKPDIATKKVEGWLVEEMIPPGREIVIGGLNDPQFGPLIMVGLGGIFVELLGDVRFRIAPLTDHDADELMREIRGFKLLEGYRGQPRLKPPFPAIKGLYGKPTVVNNVETLSNLPHIVQRGGAWFKSIGTEKSAGTRLFCCSGHINRPGTYEMAMGTPIRELLEEECGGMWKDRSLKAFQPGGGSMQVLLPQHLDLALDMDAVQQAGSSLGAGAMVFMDETTCMVNVSMRLVDFYHHESCGKCAPCREGTYFESDLMHRLEAGACTSEELNTLADICDNMNGKCFCPLGDTATWFVMSAYKAFREEFDAHCGAGSCPVRSGAAQLVTA